MNQYLLYVISGPRGGSHEDDHENLPDMRQDVHPPGGGAALAGLLPGMPGEVSAGGDDYANLPGMRAALHI